MATTLTHYEMWYGRDEPPPAAILLRAGDLQAEFQDGDLRYIRFAGRELIRRIYVAIRDVNWDTIPGVMTGLEVELEAKAFRIKFESAHQNPALQFRWRAFIEGKADGTITYRMEGLAERDFRYCRIGFCVLHPIQGIAGSPYRVKTPSGVVSGKLHSWIEPQRIENGFEIPITPSCSSLTVDMPDGIQITSDFEGDLFEMEDQRNWTDGSFKTYCTPLSLGYPHQSKTGQVFQQAVTVKMEEPPRSPRSHANEVRTSYEAWRDETSEISRERSSHDLGGLEVSDLLHLTIQLDSEHILPRIGFGLPPKAEMPDPRTIQLLSRLHPDHLKAELHIQERGWTSLHALATTLAQRIDCSLELAVFISGNPEMAMDMVKTWSHGTPVNRINVFHEAEAANQTTSARWMKLAREAFSNWSPQAALYGGTNGNFAELNRQPPDISVMDGVCYPINPQVHMPDERSLIEALEAQGETVRTARRYCGDLPISISSVTLKPPFNPAATEAVAPADPDQLPASVDPRQMSLFTAAWTVGSLCSLAAGGASSITYYETTGWGGLVEEAAGSPLPEKFRSFPGMIYPVYYVFAFLSEFKGARLIPMTCEKPLLAGGFAVSKAGGYRVLVPNYQPRPQAVRLEGLPPGAGRIWRLNQDTMLTAASDPDDFLKLSAPLNVQDGAVDHMLEPYETACFEIENA